MLGCLWVKHCKENKEPATFAHLSANMSASTLQANLRQITCNSWLQPACHTQSDFFFFLFRPRGGSPQRSGLGVLSTRESCCGFEKVGSPPTPKVAENNSGAGLRSPRRLSEANLNATHAAGSAHAARQTNAVRKTWQGLGKYPSSFQEDNFLDTHHCSQDAPLECSESVGTKYKAILSTWIVE